MDYNDIAGISDQKQKTELYRTSLLKVIEDGDTNACTSFVDHMLQERVPLVISRQMLQIFVQNLAKLPPGSRKAVALYMLQKMQPREVSFDEQLIGLREQLSELHLADQEYSEAARVLAGIDLERTTRNVDDISKLRRYIKITQLYLLDDDAVSAEPFFKKASPFIGACKDPAEEYQYTACYAQILDNNRRFLEAAQRYLEMSSSAVSIASEDEIDLLLQNAVTCAILASAGAQRSRMLAMLYKDDRVCDVRRVPQYPILEKMFLDRLVTKEDAAAFSSTLKEHQQARLPDGFTVLESAVIQHNLLSVSKMYINISFDELSSVLGLPADKAEMHASEMICEGRLKGHIDQVDNYLHFVDEMEQLKKWDEQIMSCCETVNSIVAVCNG